MSLQQYCSVLSAPSSLPCVGASPSCRSTAAPYYISLLCIFSLRRSYLFCYPISQRLHPSHIMRGVSLLQHAGTSSSYSACRVCCFHSQLLGIHLDTM